MVRIFKEHSEKSHCCQGETFEILSCDFPSLSQKIPKTSSGISVQTPFKQCRLSVNHMLWFNLLHSWEYLTKKPNENLLLALHVSFWEIMSLFTQNRLPRGKDSCATSNKHRSLTFQRTPSERFQWGYTLCKTVRAWCNLIAFLFPLQQQIEF